MSLLSSESQDKREESGLKASICMATYNGSRYVREQIDSVLEQLQPGDELIVSDDGSTDDTTNILETFGESLRLVGTHRVGGVVANFSRALAHAKGDIIFLADQDDVWLPGRLSAMRGALANCDLVLANATLVDGDLRPTGPTLFELIRPRKGLLSNLSRNSFVGCCMGFRRSVLSVAMPMPAGTPWHDWLIGLIACWRGQVTFLDTPLLLFRRHQTNASPTGKRSPNSLFMKLQLRARIILVLVVCLSRARSIRS